METIKTSYSVAEYCDAMQRGEVIVNRDYQRSDKVWPPAARSYLIETILLGYPMPKLLLRQITDLKSKKTYREIVDGQQRSMAISDFFDDQLTLSSKLETEEVAGRTYSGLTDEYKGKFLAYSLSADLFVAATPDEIRETFRRINSYTVPLNPEEQRHASYQGEFKWFVHRLTKRFDQSFMKIGLFPEKQLVRMADAKLVTEICHAMLHGIKTTKKSDLNLVYSDFDDDFPNEEQFIRRLTEAFDQLIEWSPLHHGPLMKPHLIYSLILALIHVRRAVETLENVYASPRLKRVDKEVALPNLTALGEAIEEDSKKFSKFVEACSEETNVREQRETRFIWLCKALHMKKL